MGEEGCKMLGPDGGAWSCSFTLTFAVKSSGISSYSPRLVCDNIRPTLEVHSWDMPHFWQAEMIQDRM